MSKEEWEEFWEYLLDRIWNGDEWWFCEKLRSEKEEFEDVQKQDSFIAPDIIAGKKYVGL